MRTADAGWINKRRGYRRSEQREVGNALNDDAIELEADVKHATIADDKDNVDKG